MACIGLIDEDNRLPPSSGHSLAQFTRNSPLLGNSMFLGPNAYCACISERLPCPIDTKRTPISGSKAFTSIEVVVVVIVTIALFVSVWMPIKAKQRRDAIGLACLNNLKYIGDAYHVWSGDSGDRYPFQVPVKEGGWGDFLVRPDQGALCWTNYALMGNELGAEPRILVCPADERKPAGGFRPENIPNSNSSSRPLPPGSEYFKDNSQLSYFVGVSSTVSEPNSVIGGDRHLGQGAKPDPEYGLSPASGKGNDVAVAVNSKVGEVSWSLKLHSNGRSAGVGNILLADGSAQKTTSTQFYMGCLSKAKPGSLWPTGHTPSTPSIRLITP